MSYVRITIEVDDDGTRERLKEMAKRTKDLKPVFRWARKELRDKYTENFKESGLLVGGWAPLDAEYSAWKFENFRFPAPLTRTGNLFRGVSKLNYDEVEKTKATFGVSGIEYAKFHQYGTKNMPQRKIIFEPRGFANDLGEKAASYIKEGRSRGD